MAMQINSDAEDEAIGAINTTPLVDVMLVLLIIFLITIPVVTTSVKVDLPKETHFVRETKPENVIVSVNATGQVYIYDSLITDQAGLQERLRQYAAMQPQPQVEIRGDGRALVDHAGRVLYAAQRAGIVKIGFITEPMSP